MNCIYCNIYTAEFSISWLIVVHAWDCGYMVIYVDICMQCLAIIIPLA